MLYPSQYDVVVTSYWRDETEKSADKMKFGSQGP